MKVPCLSSPRFASFAELILAEGFNSTRVIKIKKIEADELGISLLYLHTAVLGLHSELVLSAAMDSVK